MKKSHGMWTEGEGIAYEANQQITRRGLAMKHIENVGETILLNGQPLSLVTRAGVKAWVEQTLH